MQTETFAKDDLMPWSVKKHFLCFFVFLFIYLFFNFIGTLIMLFCKLLCHGTGSMQYHAVLLGVERQGFLLLSPLPVSPRSDSQMKPVSARCPVWTEKSYFGKLTCLISLHSLPHHSLCLPVQLWKKTL